MRRAPATPSVAPPATPAEWRDSRRLVEDYTATLGVDLQFQDFAVELDNFEREYSAPAGAFLLARDAGRAVGCVGLRRFDDERGEIKRLYVVPAARGRGAGTALVHAIVAAGQRLGYPRLVLDTLPSMTVAQALYGRLGFRPVAPYRFNPVPGTVFLELALRE